MAQHLRKYPSTLLKPNQNQAIVKTKRNPCAQAAGSKTPFRPAPLPVLSFASSGRKTNRKSKRRLTQDGRSQLQENLGVLKCSVPMCLD
ncbi:unnamed protein product [Prunus armeniaca]